MTENKVLAADGAEAPSPHRGKKLGERLKREGKRNYALYLMILPVVVFFIIFSYFPMVGLVAAFKDYKPTQGIFGSPWAENLQGQTDIFFHFKTFFGDPYFGRLLRNTLIFSLLDLLFVFPAPIILALLMQSIQNKKYRRVTQTMVYMPYFISMVVVCGIMLMKKGDGNTSAAGQFTSSMKNMKGAMGIGFGAYAVVAMVLAIVCGLLTDMSIPMFILWVLFAAFAALASELIVGISAMHSGWFPGFATALIFLIVGMLIGFPPLALGILAGYTAATGPCFSDMAYDLKCGYILRGEGKDPELEKVGRQQQFYAELFGFAVAFVMALLFANKYFDQGMFVAVSNTYKSTIEAGTSMEVAKWLLIWAVPGAVIQWLGGHKQIGILFATGLLVGSTINGITILVALLIRYIAVKRNPENEATLTILGAGALAGSALYSFFTATLGLVKRN